MNAHFPRLFEPIRIGAKVARNRVMRLATTTTNTAENGLVHARTVALYRNIASGGAGIIVAEAMRVHASNAGRDGAMLCYRKGKFGLETMCVGSGQGLAAIFERA
jgi:2,4-dienoyl-CoA reductase-like NADH-dependent reductase (Old Yellow Enzyme family)